MTSRSPKTNLDTLIVASARWPRTRRNFLRNVASLGLAASLAVNATNKIVASTHTRATWNTSSSYTPFSLYSTLEPTRLTSMAKKLDGFREEVENVLGMSFDIDEIRIVVLRDKLEYDAYLEEHFPKLPKRRALFVQHRGPGLILTYSHGEWLVDARHECAHAFLHTCRSKLPSWMDEGLAEYFETNSTDRLAHQEHIQGVLAQIRYGQVPAIDDLEQWHIETPLESKQYRDAWSVVAFLLHHSPESRLAFQHYLKDLQAGTAAGYLSRRLSKDLRQDWRKEYLRFYQRRS